MLGAILPMGTYVPVLIVMYGNKIFKKEKSE
jgi:hypothetical protein